MAKYAADTSVSTDKSKAEIERTLARYGAQGFTYGYSDDDTVVNIGFRLENRVVKLQLPLPDRNDPEFTETPSRQWARTEEQAYKAWEQACRQCWRALALVIKAKLEAVDACISDFESEFMAHILLPHGYRVGDFMKPQIAKAYTDGGMPELLPSCKALKVRNG